MLKFDINRHNEFQQAYKQYGFISWDKTENDCWSYNYYADGSTITIDHTGEIYIAILEDGILDDAIVEMLIQLYLDKYIIIEK